MISGLRTLGLLLCAVFVPATQAQTLDWGEEYATRITSTRNTSPLSDGLFGDQVSLFNGTVSFSASDIDLPGNDSLPVTLKRSYDPQDASAGRLIGSWDLDVPRLQGVHSAAQPWGPLQRCSTVTAPPSVSCERLYLHCERLLERQPPLRSPRRWRSACHN